jgi:hypothetical protein
MQRIVSGHHSEAQSKQYVFSVNIINESVGYEVLTVMTMRSITFWYVTSARLYSVKS